MFQLILHYPFTHVPEAVDVSGADNHGVVRRPDVGFAPNGAATGSGALKFYLPTCRVSVTTTPLISSAMPMPMIVTIGTAAFFSACVTNTFWLAKPLACAVRM